MAASAAAVGVAVPTQAARRPIAPKALLLENINTGERLKTVYWADGKYQRGGLKAINHLMRDHRTNEVCQIDTRLLELLNSLHRKLDTTQPFMVVSGYRSPASNAILASMSDGVASNSFHTHGMAVDIRVQGRELHRVQHAALSLNAGGVGFYPRSNFVHVDIGKVRHW